MNNTHLNIITFNVPYPPDYGGVIDVYYKMKALHEAGVKIHLHCFEYGRKQCAVLDELCEEVNYYNRDKMWKGFFTDKPFIVNSRNSPVLKKNLLKNDFPILFEGLHCCYFLPDEALRTRLKFVRMHNNEVKYYLHLAQREKKIFTKLYFFEEYRRLMRYENVLRSADAIYCISKGESEFYAQRFPKAKYLAPFHGNTNVTSIQGSGNYILYHGNLSVNENNESALWLMKNIVPHIAFPFIIAGNSPSEELLKSAAEVNNCNVIIDPGKEKMDELICNAHINLLPAFQTTGIKLKLINALFNGRYCVVNEQMIEGTGLEKYCYVANDIPEMLEAIRVLLEKDFGTLDIEARKQIESEFSDKKEAEKILTML